MLGIHNFLKLFLIWDSFKIYLVAFFFLIKIVWDSTINPPNHIWNEGSLIFI